MRTSARLTPEFRFLLLAIRTVHGGGDFAPLRRAAGADLDWTTFVAGVRRHGVHWLATPLLAEPELLPAAAAVELRRMIARQALETLQRVDETVRVSRALEARGIRFLMIKGAPLAVQLHGDATRRAARDLDLIIERGKAAETGALMKELGYFLPGGDEPVPEGAAAIAKEIGYVHSDSHVLVEVHDRLTDNEALLPWDFETLWSAREQVAVGAHRVPTMARHHLPPYLCVHGAKHCWARLLWLHDLAAVLDTSEAIERALADAEALGLRAAMLHSLAILHDWFGHPVPPERLAQARASRHVRLLDTLVARFHADRHWHEQPERHSWRLFWKGSVQSRIFAYAIKPEWRYWRAQLASELSSPADRALMPLPAGLAWLYPLLRPFGWLVRRLRR